MHAKRAEQFTLWEGYGLLHTHTHTHTKTDTHTHKNPKPPKRSLLTGEGNVEAPIGVGVVCQELETGYVGTGGDGRGQDVT